MATRFILVGAEGMSEMNLPNPELPGVRKTTEDEYAAFRSANVGDGAIATVDPTGRPYWLVAVDDDAPEHIRKKAENYRRVVRLVD